MHTQHMQATHSVQGGLDIADLQRTGDQPSANEDRLIFILESLARVVADRHVHIYQSCVRRRQVLWWL